jgi:hypothetical protein
MKSIIAIAVTGLLIIVVMIANVIPGQWDIVSISPTQPSPYNDGTVCQLFEHRNGVEQLICVEDVGFMWRGKPAPELAYYIQDGTLRLF